ncbi:hypothetical protein VNO78_33741 [Psophocarpus tetragonolobus]|uniref:Uncharacterized protein n=1 Tax=Psophocarpus tetragonolobus TaxID=3891 RepID=A0AAN9NXJ0_PSOTE
MPTTEDFEEGKVKGKTLGSDALVLPFKRNRDYIAASDSGSGDGGSGGDGGSDGGGGGIRANACKASGSL